MRTRTDLGTVQETNAVPVYIAERILDWNLEVTHGDPSAVEPSVIYKTK